MKRKEFLEERTRLLQGLTKEQREEIAEDYKQCLVENAKEINKDFKSQHKGLIFFLAFTNTLFFISMIAIFAPIILGLITQGVDALTKQEYEADFFWYFLFFFSLILSAILKRAKSKQYNRYTNVLTIEFLKYRINTAYGGNIQTQTTAKHKINISINFKTKTSQDRMNEYIANQKDVSVVLAFLGRLNVIESFRLLFFLLIPVVLLIPCIELGGPEGITYYQLVKNFKIFENLELLIKTGEIGESFDPWICLFVLVTLIIYLVYTIKFLKHFINSTTAASRYRPLVEKNIYLLGLKDNKKGNIFLFVLEQILQVIARGGWLWIAIIIYVTLAYPFMVLAGYHFGNATEISQIFEVFKNVHTAVMESEIINKLPLFLAGILFCLFYLTHLHKEMVKRNNPKFTAILDLD